MCNIVFISKSHASVFAQRNPERSLHLQTDGKNLTLAKSLQWRSKLPEIIQKPPLPHNLVMTLEPFNPYSIWSQNVSPPCHQVAYNTATKRRSIADRSGDHFRTCCHCHTSTFPMQRLSLCIGSSKAGADLCSGSPPWLLEGGPQMGKTPSTTFIYLNRVSGQGAS